MGLYNIKHDLITNPYLKEGVCPICTSGGFMESFENMSRDTFDYKCEQCNPQVIIGITDVAIQSRLLKDLSVSPGRFELKEDIGQWKEPFYPVTIKTLNHFLGHAYNENIAESTFEKWIKGDLPGLPKLYQNIQLDELKKINAEQEKIFETKIRDRVVQLKNQFQSRMDKSLDQQQLLEKEIESLRYLLLTDNLPYKGAENEIMVFGSLQLPLYKIRCIRESYRDAVNGELEINHILSPNQKINVGSARAKEQCMVDAVSYKRYLDSLVQQSTKKDKDHDNEFTDDELASLHKKIDGILDMISQMKFELQSGQQVIFDEIEDLKSLPALKKKNWIEIVRGKLLSLVMSKVITVEVFHKIYRALTGDDIKLLGE
jgi:hypothetical protein